MRATVAMHSQMTLDTTQIITIASSSEWVSGEPIMRRPPAGQGARRPVSRLRRFLRHAHAVAPGGLGAVELGIDAPAWRRRFVAGGGQGRRQSWP